MKHLPHALAVLILALAGAAAAQLPTGDLELQVVQGPPAVTPPNTTGHVTFRIVNHGPDPIGVSPTGPDDGVWLIGHRILYSQDFGGMVVFFWPISGDLVTWDWGILDPGPGQDPTGEFLYTFLLLQPGESRTLTVEYHVAPFAAELFPDGHFSVPWHVTLAAGNVDPDPDNDTASISFHLAPPTPVPTLDPVGLAALAFGLVVAFAWSIKSR
jgi:hypothetical protein